MIIDRDTRKALENLVLDLREEVAMQEDHDDSGEDVDFSEIISLINEITYLIEEGDDDGLSTENP